MLWNWQQRGRAKGEPGKDEKILEPIVVILRMTMELAAYSHSSISAERDKAAMEGTLPCLVV